MNDDKLWIETILAAVAKAKDQVWQVGHELTQLSGNYMFADDLASLHQASRTLADIEKKLEDYMCTLASGTDAKSEVSQNV